MAIKKSEIQQIVRTEQANKIAEVEAFIDKILKEAHAHKSFNGRLTVDITSLEPSPLIIEEIIDRYVRAGWQVKQEDRIDQMSGYTFQRLYFS